MIVQAILHAIYVVAHGIWSLLPAWTWTFPTSAFGLVSQLSRWNKVLPFSEVMTCCGIAAALAVAMWALYGARWMTQLIRG